MIDATTAHAQCPAWHFVFLRFAAAGPRTKPAKPICRCCRVADNPSGGFCVPPAVAPAPGEPHEDSYSNYDDDKTMVTPECRPPIRHIPTVASTTLTTLSSSSDGGSSYPWLKSGQSDNAFESVTSGSTRRVKKKEFSPLPAVAAETMDHHTSIKVVPGSSRVLWSDAKFRPEISLDSG
eukprot:scaffold7808_cov184-Amphora_coffeaeformis.AAC.20